MEEAYLLWGGGEPRSRVADGGVLGRRGRQTAQFPCQGILTGSSCPGFAGVGTTLEFPGVDLSFLADGVVHMLGESSIEPPAPLFRDRCPIADRLPIPRFCTRFVVRFVVEDDFSNGEFGCDENP